jgi:cytoskeletal protein RodZ
MTETTTPAPEVQPPTPPPKKRHRVRKTLLIIGSAFVALIVIIVIIAVATSNSPTPITPPAAKATAAASAKPSVAPSTPPPSTSSVAQFGTTTGFKYSDGLKVYVTSATPTSLSQEAAGGNPGDPAVNLTVKVVAGKASLDASEITVDANGGPDGTQLSAVFDNNVNEPSGTLAPGETGTYQFEFDLVQASNGAKLNVTITPGFDYNSSSFAGSVSGS